MKLATILAVTVAAGAMIPAAAFAETIALNFSQDTSDQPFNAFQQTFVLPVGFTNAKLNIISLISDDAAVASLNGTRLYGAGIFGPGVGNFYFTANGTSVPFTFAANGDANVSFTSPFMAGTNTFTLFVNNNNAGINTGNGPLTVGPGRVEFVGNVTFDVTAVPEPATWGMMMLGFGMVGYGLRSRRNNKVSTRVTFA